VSEEAPDQNAPEPCGACRGTGAVISNLGGEPHEQPCPWCDGGGVNLRDHDAQARWRADAGSTEP
jgi:DnaJ-class molecular chaperone